MKKFSLNFNIPLELELVKNANNAIKAIKAERDSTLVDRIQQKLNDKADEMQIGLDVLVLSSFIKGHANQPLTAIALELVEEIPIGVIQMREQIDQYCQFKAIEKFAKERLSYFESRIECTKD
jgi:hypothetical protein|nr:MAG TPA: hypothetical protein [Ackermannviridae sp.]